MVAAVAFAVYANTLFNGFLNDDEHQVLLNPWITDLRSLPAIFTQSVWGFVEGKRVSDYYRPLMHVVYLIDHQIFGFHAWGFHLVNVILHALNTALVFFLTKRLTAGSGAAPADPTTPADFLLAAPFAAALLFATHPVHTEAVAWVAAVPELTFTFFGLSCLLFHIGSDERPRFRLASFAAFTLALLCKETAVTLPAVLLAYDLALRRKRRPLEGAVARFAPYLLITSVYLIVRHAVLSKQLLIPSKLWTLGPYETLINVLPLFRDYVRFTLLPFPLSFWHVLRPISSLLTSDGLSSLAVASAFVAAGVLMWKKDRLSFFALALFVLPLFPAFYISALPAKPFAERYLYLPSVGFVVLAALVLRRLSVAPRMKAVAAVMLVATTVLYSAATIQRNRVWKDAFTLYVDTTREMPDAPVSPLDLAMKLLKRGYVDEAIAQYRILAKFKPDDATYQSSLGGALIRKGFLDEGMEHLRAALAVDPRSLDSYVDLGVALKRKGRTDEAVAMYREALAIDPDHAEVHFNLGGALADGGHIEEALDHYRIVVRLKPENAYYRNMLGIEYGRQGLLSAAIEQFREAVRLEPAEVAYRRNLDRALALGKPGG